MKKEKFIKKLNKNIEKLIQIKEELTEEKIPVQCSKEFEDKNLQPRIGRMKEIMNYNTPIMGEKIVISQEDYKKKVYENTIPLNEKENEFYKNFGNKFIITPSDTSESIKTNVRPIDLDTVNLSPTELNTCETFVKHIPVDNGKVEGIIKSDPQEGNYGIDDLLDIFNESDIQEIKNILISLIAKSKNNEIKISDIFYSLKGKKVYNTPKELLDATIKDKISEFIETKNKEYENNTKN